MAGRDLALFSAEWFSCGRSLLDGVRIAPECSARVQFEAQGTQWFLTIDGGRVTGWDLEGAENPSRLRSLSFRAAASVDTFRR